MSTQSSLIKSLLDPNTPTFLFGCTPPSSKLIPAKVAKVVKKFVERGRVLAVDGFIVYDVQDESSRTSDKRPFPFRTLHDSSWYAGLITSEAGKSCIVYKAAPCDPNFDDWLSDSVTKDGHTALTVVGAPSSKGKHLGPSTKAACQQVNKLSNVHFGCVCIAERHVKHRCEHEILIKKMEWGAEWFITQGIYDPNPMIAVIKDYSRKCRELKLKPKKIILTFTPCGRRKTMSFIKWLGMQVPEEIERRIFGCLESEEGLLGELTIENALGKEQKEVVSPGNPVMKKKISKKTKKPKTPVEISCDIMCENLKAILEATSTCGVPLGINVESVSGYRDEIDATHELFRLLQTMMLNHAGVPWIVTYQQLEISARRRMLTCNKSGSVLRVGDDSVVSNSDAVSQNVVAATSISTSSTWNWKNNVMVAAGAICLGLAAVGLTDTKTSSSSKMRDSAVAIAISAMCFTQAIPSV